MSVQADDLRIVSIELVRVQTFLFAVPRLREMLGGNALLGRMLRQQLPELVIECQGPDQAWLSCMQPLLHLIPAGDPDDPLTEAVASKAKHVSGNVPFELHDDPQALARRGILSRDGGHFRALFPNEKAALAFLQRARALLAHEAPGLRYETGMQDANGEKVERINEHAAPYIAVDDLPVFQVCEASGRGPAREIAPHPEDGFLRKEYLSRTAKKMRDAGDEFRKGQSVDVVGLLSASNKFSLPMPSELSDIADSQYLAVIQADGNDFGKLGKAFVETVKRDGRFEGQPLPDGPDALLVNALYERFYHAARVRVRKAVIAATQKTFAGAGKNAFQILMLGGDDLLLICRASYALQFAVDYAHAIKNCSTNHSPNEGEEARAFTVKLGIAIARQTFPFYRLHELAEELATSAKRAYVAAKPASVVDWLVCTQAWSQGIEHARRRDLLVELEGGAGSQSEFLALSGRPYPVLDRKDGASVASLEQVIAAANALGTEANARSQWKRLAQSLRSGRRYSTLALEELARRSQGTWNALADHFGKDSQDRLCAWMDCGKDIDGKARWLTRLPDVVEAAEIGRLGRKQTTQASFRNEPEGSAGIATSAPQ